MDSAAFRFDLNFSSMAEGKVGEKSVHNHCLPASIHPTPPQPFPTKRGGKLFHCQYGLNGKYHFEVQNRWNPSIVKLNSMAGFGNQHFGV